jgi:hypothetical protein
MARFRQSQIQSHQLWETLKKTWKWVEEGEGVEEEEAAEAAEAAEAKAEAKAKGEAEEVEEEQAMRELQRKVMGKACVVVNNHTARSGDSNPMNESKSQSA